MDFLLLENLVALYGGAAGGGKSDALLMGALMNVDVPNYSAILFRRTLADHNLPEGLIPRSQAWLGPLQEQGLCKYSAGKNQWQFPTVDLEGQLTWNEPSNVSFGYMRQTNDMYRYQSSAYQYIGFDEQTQFEEVQFAYMFSRLRKTRFHPDWLQLRMRGATNPGGVGHEWVKDWYIPESYNFEHPQEIYYKKRQLPSGRVVELAFIPARLQENLYLDQQGYIESLDFLDPITRSRLLSGDWSDFEGGLFSRAWFKPVKKLPYGLIVVRFWDLAGSEGGGAYTAGVLMGYHPKTKAIYVIDAKREQFSPGKVEKLILETSHEDLVRMDNQKWKSYVVRMEEEGGSAGKNVTMQYARLLRGFNFRGIRPSGAKETRIGPFSSYTEAENVHVLISPVEDNLWINPYFNELTALPDGKYWDQADASSGAFNILVRRKPRRKYRSRLT